MDVEGEGVMDLSLSYIYIGPCFYLRHYPEARKLFSSLD